MNNIPANAPLRPRLVTSNQTLRSEVRSLRQAGKTIGLVPTMGALHEGHLSLVRQSVAQCDCTIVTIFINPTQFDHQEDLSRYPHTLQNDLAALAKERVDLVFAPSAQQIYPPGFSTYVEPPNIAKPLEGASRPGHLRGVTTIVLKLFLLIPADIAFFGQKDFQQARVIEQMVRDLDVPIRIEICPIVRESDGLAMSSRNRFLTKPERQQSLALHKSIQLAAGLFRDGERNSAKILGQMQDLLDSNGVKQIDYVALVDPATLSDVDQVTDSTMVLVAAFVGTTRLIDNRRMG